METLYLLIPMSVALVFLIAVLFWWSLRNGQYDDLEGPGYRILMDDDRPVVKEDEPDESGGLQTAPIVRTGKTVQSSVDG